MNHHRMKCFFLTLIPGILLFGCSTTNVIVPPAPESISSESSAPGGTPAYEASSQHEASPQHEPEVVVVASEPRKGVGHSILLYLPNRVFDLLDVVRFRVRVGPGFAVGARVTKPVSLFLGFYSALWIGIPGPRNGPKLNLPVGGEARVAAQASLAEVGGTGGVEYGPAEIGFDVQAAIVGLAVGVEPWDALDFLAGLIFLDPRGDDL